MPRPHHFNFAKRTITDLAFRDPDKMFQELTAPMRDTFLFYMWGETAPATGALPHVDNGARLPGGTFEVTKLEVAGALERNGFEVVTISLPLAREANEANHMALVRHGGTLSVYYFELTAEGTDSVLAGRFEDGSRANFGFFDGASVDHFHDALSGVLGISLDGLVGSLPEPDLAKLVEEDRSQRLQDAYALAMTRPGQAGPGSAATGEAGPAETSDLGALLEKLLLLRAAVPILLFPVGMVMPVVFTGGYLSMAITGGTLLLALLTLVWLYNTVQLHQDSIHHTPGMAVAWWVIPGANFIMPPVVMQDLWRAARGDEQPGLIYGWWFLWIINTLYTVMMSSQSPFFFELLLDILPFELVSISIALFSAALTFGAYGGLWFIVKSIRDPSS